MGKGFFFVSGETLWGWKRRGGVLILGLTEGGLLLIIRVSKGAVGGYLWKVEPLSSGQRVAMSPPHEQRTSFSWLGMKGFALCFISSLMLDHISFHVIQT